MGGRGDVPMTVGVRLRFQARRQKRAKRLIRSGTRNVAEIGDARWPGDGRYYATREARHRVSTQTELTSSPLREAGRCRARSGRCGANCWIQRARRCGNGEQCRHLVALVRKPNSSSMVLVSHCWLLHSAAAHSPTGGRAFRCRAKPRHKKDWSPRERETDYVNTAADETARERDQRDSPVRQRRSLRSARCHCLARSPRSLRSASTVGGDAGNARRYL